RQATRVPGALWFTSSRPAAFADEHYALMDAVADLIGLAVHHEHLRSTEAIRRERLDTLDRLLQTMAGALDIRQIFAEVSDVIRVALPHDILAMTAWGEGGRTFRVYAMAGERIDDPTFWQPITVPEQDRVLLSPKSYVVYDIATEVPADSVRTR